ncbi:hypothetical protein [Herpetosiphon gulosus]|uniref:DnaA N-terminal domain-containing protein n=1 Tax=Herpetosiphon gulosus TaxID=1973496 RepID=A0ABP9X5Y2_9CHLR
MPSTHPSGGAEVMRNPSWLAAPDRSYLWFPTKLAETLAHAPLALGIYALIVRRWLVNHTSVPLSALDIQTYDPSLTRAKIRTAFDQLIAGHWLAIPNPPQHGCKIAYVPTWGRQREGVRQWDTTQSFNRGRVATHRLDRTILDTYLGRIEPRQHGQPLITRYLTTPALTLTDVGVYMLLVAGVPHRHATATLQRRGLCQQNVPLAIPTMMEIMAQGTMSLHGAQHLQLLPRGGIMRPSDPDSRPNLFFVEPDLATIMVTTMATNLAMTDSVSEDGFEALGSEKTAVACEQKNVTGRSCKIGRRNQPPENTLHSIQNGGGVSFSDSTNERLEREPEQDVLEPKTRIIPAARNIMSTPDTPQVALLRSLAIRPKQVLEFAAIDLATLETVVADARQRSGIRDIGGWVVSILRDIQNHGWEPAAAKWQIDQPCDFEASLSRWYAFVGQDVPSDGAAEDAAEACIESAPPPVVVDWATLEPLLDPTVTDTALAAQEPPHRPLWIPAVLWLRLRASVRMLLLASRCDGRSITAGDAWRQAQLALPAYRTVLPAFIHACEALRE